MNSIHKVVTIIEAKTFKKTYKKLPPTIQQKFKRRFPEWCNSPFEPAYKLERVRSDKTKRTWKWSVDDDYRCLIEWQVKFSSVILIGVYTHNELRALGYY